MGVKGMLWECCLENLLRWMALLFSLRCGVFSGAYPYVVTKHNAGLAVIQSTMALPRPVARATSLPNNSGNIRLVCRTVHADSALTQ